MRPLLLLLPLLFLPNCDSYGAAGPTFEVASVKPNTSNPAFVYLNGPPMVPTFAATNATVQALIIYAYQVNAFQLEGGPAWLRSDRFDISAKPPEGVFSRDQYKIMVQALLEDRFKLAVHRTTKEAPVYALVPAKGGLKIKPASAACSQTGSDRPGARPPEPDSPPVCGNLRTFPNSFDGRSVSITMLLRGLANALGRPVVDQTGFTTPFDLHLEFAPPMAPPDNPAPTIFTALQEQLGLRLESQKGPAEFLVIDHAEKPTEN